MRNDLLLLFYRRRTSGASVPRIQLSGLSIAEDAEVGDLIGTLSVANSPEGVSWTFTLGEGAPETVALDESDDTLLEVAGALDSETDPTLSVPVVATSDEDPATVLNRTFDIGVTNVLEVTLNALTLDADEIDAGAPEDTVVGAVVGKSSGSTLSLIGNAGGKYKLSGTNIVAGATPTTAGTDEITLRETHADGSNSPRDTVIAITVLEEGGASPIGLLVSLGDSVTNHGSGTLSYAALGAAETDPLLNYNNEAINGTGAATWITNAPDTIALFDGISDTEPKIVSVMLGNTLNHEGGDTIARAIELFDLFRRSSNNIKVILIGDLDRGDGLYRSIRTDVIAWALTNIGIHIDGFVNMKADLPDGMGADGAADNETWYPTDAIHPGQIIHDAAAPLYTAGVDALVADFLSDTSAPTIVRFTPVDGATTVQVEEFPFVARFNKQVRFTSDVLITLYDGADSIVEQWTEADIGSGIAIFGVDLEITPSAPLADGSDYYINISSGSIEDISGNAFAGIADTTTWRFAVPLDVDLTPNLISFWELEEASGTRVDSHGSNDLADNNTVTQNTGKVGNAAEFVAANTEYLSIADNADLGYDGDFSVAGWFMMPSVQQARIVGKGADTFAQNEFQVAVSFSSGFKASLSVYVSSGSAGGAGDATSLQNNTWYFFVGTYNATTRVPTFTLNGGTRNVGSALAGPPARKSQPFHIGRFGSTYMTGRIDQIGFWKRVLTVEEEAWLYNLGNGRTYAEIAATGA
jgi:hypothetical protein